MARMKRNWTGSSGPFRAHDRHGNRRVNNQPAGWFRTTFRPNRNRSPTEPFASLWWVKVFPGESHSWGELNSIHMCKNTTDCYRALCVGFYETYFRSVHPVLHAAWLDTLLVCVFLSCSVGFAAFPLPDDCGAKRLHGFHRLRCSQKCGQHPKSSNKADDTVGKRVGGSGRHQFASI